MSAGRRPETPAHPEHLPWLAAGQLDGEEEAQVRRHLADCPECRRELDALLSMRETMQRHDRTDHVPVTDLVAYHVGEVPAGDPRALTIEAHVRGCSACFEDLAALRRSQLAMDSEPPSAGASPEPARGSRRWLPWAMATAVAAALLVFAARPLLRPGPFERAAALRSFQEVTFARPTRGGSPGIPALGGDPPWAIRVLLPYGAAPGAYDIAVVDSGGTAVPGSRVRAPASADGVVTILLESLPAPGSYRLVLRSLEGSPPQSIEYPFDYPAHP
jgi:hypothetical protein